MFQRFTSLFFSTPSPPEDPSCPGAFVSEEDEVDGWLLIDLQATQLPPALGLLLLGGPPSSRTLLDGRELVCYPSCLFYCRGVWPWACPPPEQPLEDLLIEHPSMSVYVTGSTIVLESAPPSLTLMLSCLIRTSAMESWRLPAGSPGPCTVQLLPCPRAVLLEKAGQVRRLQRARQRAERHTLSAKVLQRQNRARESRSRRPKHQGSFIYQPCQRQFNY